MEYPQGGGCGPLVLIALVGIALVAIVGVMSGAFDAIEARAEARVVAEQQETARTEIRESNLTARLQESNAHREYMVAMAAMAWASSRGGATLLLSAMALALGAALCYLYMDKRRG